MKAFTTLFTFLFWATFAQGGLHGFACCCPAPPDPVSCCATPEPAHECPCSIEAPEEIPARVATAHEAPRPPHPAFLALPPSDTPLFRDSEKMFSRVPNLGNAPPRTGAAYLQIWRC